MAAPGEKAFGFLQPENPRRFRSDPAAHCRRELSPARRCWCTPGVSGLEIEPAMILPLVTELDPAPLRGTFVVPLLNTSGFEFEQHAADLG